MKILKIIGLSLAILVALFFIIALFLPDRYHVEESIVVERPVEDVYRVLIDHSQFGKWNPWAKIEPTAKTWLEGELGQVGSSYHWDGKELGKGSMTIVALEPYSKITEKLRFIEPMQSEADDWYVLEPTENGTKLTWGNTGDLPYPISRYFGLMLPTMLGEQFKSGLASAKELIESMPLAEPQ